MVGDVRFARKRDGDDLRGLIVVKRLKNELVEIFDVDGSAAGVGGGVSAGRSVKGSPGEHWRAGTMRTRERALSFGDTNGGLAREWRLRTSGRAAGEGK